MCALPHCGIARGQIHCHVSASDCCDCELRSEMEPLPLPQVFPEAEELLQGDHWWTVLRVFVNVAFTRLPRNQWHFSHDIFKAWYPSESRGAFLEQLNKSTTCLKKEKHVPRSIEEKQLWVHSWQLFSRLQCRRCWFTWCWRVFSGFSVAEFTNMFFFQFQVTVFNVLVGEMRQVSADFSDVRDLEAKTDAEIQELVEHREIWNKNRNLFHSFYSFYLWSIEVIHLESFWSGWVTMLMWTGKGFQALGFWDGLTFVMFLW